MADANVIAGDHAIKAAWKEIWSVQGEALSLTTLWSGNPDAEAWAHLADGVLGRLDGAIHALQTAYSQTGGMGAMAPMVTTVADSQLDPSRT